MREIMGKRSDKVTKSYNEYEAFNTASMWYFEIYYIDHMDDAVHVEHMLSLIGNENSFDRT